MNYNALQQYCSGADRQRCPLKNKYYFAPRYTAPLRCCITLVRLEFKGASVQTYLLGTQFSNKEANMLGHEPYLHYFLKELIRPCRCLIHQGNTVEPINNPSNTNIFLILLLVLLQVQKRQRTSILTTLLS